MLESSWKWRQDAKKIKFILKLINSVGSPKPRLWGNYLNFLSTPVILFQHRGAMLSCPFDIPHTLANVDRQILSQSRQILIQSRRIQSSITSYPYSCWFLHSHTLAHWFRVPSSFGMAIAVALRSASCCLAFSSPGTNSLLR
jgi:hypothetical protein